MRKFKPLISGTASGTHRYKVIALLALALTILLSVSSFGGRSYNMQDYWSGELHIEYSPTGVHGTMKAWTMMTAIVDHKPPDTGVLKVECSSEPFDYTACGVELYVGFDEQLPKFARNIVIKMFKDGELLLLHSLPRSSMKYRDALEVDWDISASSAGTLWQALSEDGIFTVQLSDANGLGRPVPFSERSYEIPILPMRALEIVKTMRTSKKPPHDWAKKVLGKCSPDMGSSQGEVLVLYAGRKFKDRVCSS